VRAGAALVLVLALGAAACGDGREPAGPAPLEGLEPGFRAAVEAAVEAAEATGPAPNPLGVVLAGCPVADEAAVRAIGAALGVPEAEPAGVLNAVAQDVPDGRAVQCALDYGEATAGAVVLSVRPGGEDLDALAAELDEAGFTRVDAPVVDGLAADRTLLLEARDFAAHRAVHVGGGLQVGLTAGDDLLGEDPAALLPALSTAVGELARVLG
jgi:hypothetical protein